MVLRRRRIAQPSERPFGASPGARGPGAVSGKGTASGLSIASLSIEERVRYWRDTYRRVAEEAERDGQDSSFERGRERFLSRLILGEVGQVRGWKRVGSNPGSRGQDAVIPGNRTVRVGPAPLTYEQETAYLDASRELRGYQEEEECPHDNVTGIWDPVCNDCGMDAAEANNPW